MRRVMSLWLPRWSTDRISRRAAATRAEGAFSGGAARRAERPFVTALTIGSRRLVAAASPAAIAAGIGPGLPLADAQAFLPGLAIHDADPAGDGAALRRLADWCGRWSPWTAPDGADGILLDVTGCAHLFGGEARLAAAAATRIAGQGVACRAAIADTAGAAWAAARHGAAAGTVIAPGTARAALAGFPVAALRLPPELVAGLERLGLKRIGDLYAMPRAALAQRFGEALARRLDQALGRAGETLSPLRPVPARRSRLAFAEPIATPEDVARSLARLAEELCRGLAAEGMGARRLELACYRVDGVTQRAAIGTARPSRDPRHLARLFADKLAAIDPGLGIEDMVLSAALAEPLAATQLALHAARPDPLPSSLAPAGRGRGEGAEDGALAALVDRLGSRLGLANLHRLAPRESHVPERAQVPIPALAAASGATQWPARSPRPIRLFAPPEPIEAMAPVPDDPPVMFRWRRILHRVRRADGPERIAAEWWRAADPDRLGDPGPLLGDPGDVRDYYRVEDEAGRRFWLFRAGLYAAGRPARWFLHGVFA